MDIITPVLDTDFKKEVFEGLSSSPKTLPSKYFYDEKGDKLFQEIMALPEYYLTNAELEIFSIHTKAIAEYFRGKGFGFDLIELGAGDGKKTKVLLKYLADNGFNFVYKPIDISEHAVESLSQKLNEEMPEVIVNAEVGEYFEVLERLKQYNERKKVIMVLGSNIGNLSTPEATDFLTKLKDCMLEDDLLFMGFDQKKNPQTVLNAYSDKSGVTAAFNKNILSRINKELGGNFDLEKFLHWETYNPETGTAKSFLVSTEPQKISIKALDFELILKKWETIHTEISQKYDHELIQWLTEKAELGIITHFTDNKGFYRNYLFEKIMK